MNREHLKQLLDQVAGGTLSSAQALDRLRAWPGEDLEFANLDHHRGVRQDHPEVIFGAGKTPDQIFTICERIAAASSGFLATRVAAEVAVELVHRYPAARHDTLGRTVHLPGAGAAPTGDPVLVVTAGTGDLPVAAEAAVTAEAWGARVERLNDVGVAGLHRILSAGDRLRGAGAIIVVAGMEGALPSVVGGLVAVPVIAVPTSVGYGASFGGLAALLGMLNSCAAGVTVVNIDNGFGAGVAAARIVRRATRENT